jgi:PAS domain S-box-containing protein
MSRFDGKEKRTLVIYIFIFVLLVAGISAGGTLSYRNFEQQFRTQAEHQLSSIAKLKVNELVNWQKERMANAEMLHQNPVFATLVQAYFENPQDTLAQAQIQAWLGEYQIYPDYDRVRLLDPQGQTRLSDPDGLPPISSAVAKRIPEVLQSKQVTMVDFYRRETDQSIALSILVPIMDAQTGSQAIGLVALSINPETYLYPFIQSWPTLSPTAETLLVRREGNDVLFLNDLRFQPDAALNLRYPLTETELPAAKAALGQTGVVDGVDYRGEPVLADVRAVPDSPWFLVSKMDIAEVYAPLRTRLWQTLGLVGAAIFVAGMGLVAVRRQQRVLFYRAQAEAADALRESEKKYQVLTEISPVGIFKTDAQGTTTYVNPRWSQISGLSADEALGDGWLRAVHPEDRENLSAGWKQATSTQIASIIEYRFVHPDGSIAWILGQSTPERNIQNRIVGYVGTIIDITERKQAEEALKKSEIWFRSLFEKASDGIFYLSVNGVVVTVNDSFARMHGYSVEEMRKMDMKDLDTPDTTRQFAERMQRIMAGEIFSFEVEHYHKDGHTFPLEVTASMITVGEEKYVLAFHRDITERKQAEERLTASEVRYRRLFEAARDGILILDAESGVVVDVNPFLIEMLGFPKEEIVGKELWELGFFKDIAANKANFLELQQKDYIRYEDLPMETVNGRKFHVEFVSNVYQVNHHKVVQCNIRDITERKQAEDMVRAHLRLTEFAAKHSLDELLQRTLDEVCAITNSPIGFYHFVKPDQKTLSLQAWSTRTLEEYCKAEGKGLHYDVEEAGVWVDCIRQRQPVIHNDYASLPASRRKGLPEGHAALTRELVVPIMRDGLIVAILGIGNKAQDYIEKDINTVAYFADVAWETAERKRAEQTLANYTEKLEEIVDERTHELRDTQEQLVRQERLATLGQLAGSIGHELRNPLGVISNAVYFLKMSQPDANNTVKEYLDIIENETRTSDKIVTDLLDFTRIKSVDIQPVAVSELIRQTLERYPVPPSVEVSVEIAPNLPPVYADPQHILQVLGNLTVNACQSMVSTSSTTGVTTGGKLTLSASAQGDMIVMAVQDSGEGIPPENMKKLFEPLFTTKTKGIGLGLAVSQKLAEANGGHIEVQSEPGKGSTFTLVLPVYVVVPVPARDQELK